MTGTETINKLYSELGGSHRPWHPYFVMNDRTPGSIRPLEKRPADKEKEWGRPDLERHTEGIGNMVERYLEENYNMERVNNGCIDLIVTEGIFEDIEVQAKGAAVLVSQGRDANGNWYSRPGGIYMRENSINKLAERDSLLHTVVHYPRSDFQRDFEHDFNVPLEPLSPEIESALIGELILPVEKVKEEISFNNNGYCYWEWTKAYGERPNTADIGEWYKDSFIEDRLKTSDSYLY